MIVMIAKQATHDVQVVLDLKSDSCGRIKALSTITHNVACQSQSPTGHTMIHKAYSDKARGVKLAFIRKAMFSSILCS